MDKRLEDLLAQAREVGKDETEVMAVFTGSAYGQMVAARDQARDAAQSLAAQFGAAMVHLEKVLALFSRGLTPGWAADQHDVDAAQAYLAEHAPAPVDSSGTPEQEPTS